MLVVPTVVAGVNPALRPGWPRLLLGIFAVHGLAKEIVWPVRVPEFAGTTFHEVEAKSALNRVPGDSPVPFRWTVNPYRGCGHACVYCLARPTRVLLADGRTRPIADLRIGDAVVGTAPGAGHGGEGARRYVRTTVLAHWSTAKPAYRLTLTDGTGGGRQRRAPFPHRTRLAPPDRRVVPVGPAPAPASGRRPARAGSAPRGA